MGVDGGGHKLDIRAKGIWELSYYFCNSTVSLKLFQNLTRFSMGLVGSFTFAALICSLEVEGDSSPVGGEGSAQSLPVTSGVTVFRGRQGRWQRTQVPTRMTTGVACFCEIVHPHPLPPRAEATCRQESLICWTCSSSRGWELMMKCPPRPLRSCILFLDCLYFIHISQGTALRSPRGYTPVPPTAW